MTPRDSLERAISRFCSGVTEGTSLSDDVIQSSVTATISVDERLRDGEAGEACQVASFHLDQPLVSWKVRLEVGAGATLRLVLHEMTAADMSCLRVQGVVNMLERPQLHDCDKDDVEADGEGSDSGASTSAMQGSSGSSATSSGSPRPAHQGPRPPLQPPRTPVVVVTDRPATIATFHRDAVAQLRVAMTTFYFHPAEGRSQRQPDGHGKVEAETQAEAHDNLRFDRLRSDLGCLLASQDDADVTLVVGEHLLRAHRAVLAARSEVLRRLLKEAETAAHLAVAVPCDAADNTLRLELPDAPLEAVSKVLDFVYTADVRGLAGAETDVLVLASRLGLADLADECCRRLMGALDTDGGHVAGLALELLAFAERHGVRALKERALFVAVRHLREVTASPEWQDYKRRMPSLAADLLETAARVLDKP